MSEYVVGVDEVGRGSLVGSAIVCAFRSQNSFFKVLPFDVTDSKTKKSLGKRYIDYTQFLKEVNLSGKRIGYLKTMEGKNHRVDDLMYRAIDDLENIGAEIIELENIVESLPGGFSAEQNSIEVMAHEFKHGLKKMLTQNEPKMNAKSAERVKDQQET